MKSFWESLPLRGRLVMKTICLTLGVGVAALGAGCAAPAVDGEDEPVTEAGEALLIAPGSFVFHHLVNGLTCASNEVMVGIHMTQGKAICAQLNNGYQVGTAFYDHYAYFDSPGPNTQVSSSPSMHGCPTNYFIQGVQSFYGGEILRCVPLRTANGEALFYGKTLHDGRGPGDNGTQSIPTYNISPNMHSCPPSYAMVGLHVAQNDLFCGG